MKGRCACTMTCPRRRPGQKNGGKMMIEGQRAVPTGGQRVGIGRAGVCRCRTAPPAGSWTTMAVRSANSIFSLTRRQPDSPPTTHLDLAERLGSGTYAVRNVGDLDVRGERGGAAGIGDRGVGAGPIDARVRKVCGGGRSKLAGCQERSQDIIGTLYTLV